VVGGACAAYLRSISDGGGIYVLGGCGISLAADLRLVPA